MTRLILAAGVAALAITAPAASQPGDRGGGKDRKAQVQKQKAERGKARAQRAENRGQRAQRTERRAQRAERPQRAERRAQRAERPQRAERAERRQANEQRANRAERVRDARELRANRADRREQRVQAQRGNGRDRLLARDNRLERVAERRNAQIDRVIERRGVRLENRRERSDLRLARLADRGVLRADDWRDLARGGIWLDGCPPGLMKAKRVIECVPPGQAKNFVGQRVSVLRDRVELRELPQRLRLVYPDTDDYYHRFGSGYVYRVNRSNDLVSALLPLFGLGLTVGQPFPTAFNTSSYYMPTRLQSFYPDSPYTSYRYANGYVYQIDPITGLIEDVDPLLGYGYGYGQMMPATYSAYNVPYQYRPLYYDTPNYSYRYAPGAIYQVDPTTSLITAVAALLTGGMTVGQPLPTGYSAYNVPYQYRTTYYDTPDAWYRYANGHVYRVDPTTQLVTAIVASVLT